MTQRSSVDLDQFGAESPVQNLVGGRRPGRHRAIVSGDSEDRIGDGRSVIISHYESGHVDQAARGDGGSLSRLRADSARRVVNAEQGTGPLQRYISSQVDAMHGSGEMLPLQQPFDGDGGARKGIAGRGFDHLQGGEIRSLQVDADPLAIGIHRGGGVGMNSDLGADQVGVRCARLLDDEYGEGSIRQLQVQHHGVGIFGDAMDGALDLYPLGVISAGLEEGKADARRVWRKRSATENANLRVVNDGTEASWFGDTTHVHQRSGEERCRQLGSLTDKDAPSVIVNEDGGKPGAVVGIEEGDHPAQMDGIAALGLLAGEAVRLECGGECGELAL